MNFNTQFQNLKNLNLPTDQFVVVSSGALSVRGIRDSEDLDVIVTKSLWDEMIKLKLIWEIRTDLKKEEN